MTIKQFFHYVSYLQYPLVITAMVFAVKPYMSGLEQSDEFIDDFLKNTNIVFIFLGLGISFSTLQDTTKTQNKISRKVWENPRKAKIIIFIVAFFVFLLLSLGISGLFTIKETELKNLSIGIIVLGIGVLNMLKSAIELFEYHRLDKKKANE